MSSSDITVAALTATPTLRGNKLAWTYSDPRAGALPNIALDMVEVWASTTNDRASAAKAGEGVTDFLHAGLVEEQTWYYWIKARDYLGAFGAWYPSGSTAGVSARAIGIAAQAFVLANAKIVVDTHSTDATVASNDLRIAIKTLAGNTPSTADPIFVAFSNSVAGNYQTRQIAAALSLTIPSGATLGFGANEAARLWPVILDDAGTLRLGVINCLGTGRTFISSSLNRATATAVLIDTGADFANTIYANANCVCSFVVIGFLDWLSGLGTPGAWSAAPDTIQLTSPGGKLPGDILTTVREDVGTGGTGTTVIPLDDTIPQITEGVLVSTISITPLSAANLIEYEAFVNVSYSVASPIIAALFYVGVSDAIAAAWTYIPIADGEAQIRLTHAFRAATTGNIFLELRVGGTTAGTLTINGRAGSRQMGGVMLEKSILREFMG